MKSLVEAENDIDRLLTVIEETDAFDDPVSLSNIMVRLSHNNHAIGRHLAGLQASYRRKRAEVYNDIVNDLTNAKGLVTHAKLKAEEAASDLEKNYDHYYNVHNDTQTFITVCQSHLKILAMEAKTQL